MGVMAAQNPGMAPFKRVGHTVRALYIHKAAALKAKTSSKLVGRSQSCHLFLKSRLSHSCPILITKPSDLCNIFLKAVQM